MWCNSQDQGRSHVHRSVYNLARDCAVNKRDVVVVEYGMYFPACVAVKGGFFE